MTSLNRILRDEIRRMSRKELRSDLAALKKAGAQYRRDIAELKRQVQEQAREIAFLCKQEKRRLDEKPAPETKADVRFSPQWLKKHRERVGLSAEDYAKLVGASALSIYNWESGKTTPREAQKAKLSAVRGLGKREALKRLEMMAG